MSYRTITALLSSAVFLFSVQATAQVPVFDLNLDPEPQIQSQAVVAPVPAATGPAANSQGELFYQLQLLQQEVMQLRGIVEEQSHQLKKLKQQSMKRYIDLDRRLGGLTTTSSNTANKATAAANKRTGATSGIKAQLPLLEGEKAAYNNAYSMVSSKRFDDALHAFEQFLIDYPGGRYTPNSYYWLGELHQVVKPQDLEASRQAFTQLLKQYPEHAKVPDAMYKLGKVYFLKGNKTKSKEWLQRVVDEYGNGASSAADKARQFLQTSF